MTWWAANCFYTFLILANRCWNERCTKSMQMQKMFFSAPLHLGDHLKLWWHLLFSALLMASPTSTLLLWENVSEWPAWCTTAMNHSGTLELKIQSPLLDGFSSLSSEADKRSHALWGSLQTRPTSAMLFAKALLCLVPSLQKDLWLSFQSCNKPLIIHSGLHKYCTACLQWNSVSRLLTTSLLVMENASGSGGSVISWSVQRQ